MSNPTTVRVDVNFDFTTDGRWTLAEIKDILRNTLLDDRCLGHYTYLTGEFPVDRFGIGLTILDQPT